MKITEDTSLRELAMILRTRKLSVVAHVVPDGWLIEKHNEDPTGQLNSSVWADAKTLAQALDKVVKKIDSAGDR